MTNPKRRATNDVDAILADQRAYYGARAAEYDEWWLRTGRYDRGPDENARWLAEVTIVQAALDASPLTGNVLELAPGTGNWTERLARSVDHLTALDASSEMIAINRARLAAAGLAHRVSYAEVDLFAWRPDRVYDAVFMGFFLSHVPAERLDPFLAAVAAAVRPGGRVAFVDSRREPTSSSPDQPLPAADDPVMTRRLNDAREYQIIKIYRAAEEWRSAFANHGVAITVEETPTYFQYGFGLSSSRL